MNGGPSGFHNAPVTRTIVIACALLTILVGIQGRSSTLGLSYQDLFRKHQLWRLFVSAFAFSSTPELMFGLYLLYYFRVFERQIGSNKYSVFIMFSMVVTSLFEILPLQLLKEPTLSRLASRPYGLIFSSFVPFYFDIPVTTRFRIFGFRFSDKSFIYLAGLQLLLSSWKRSLLPGICGVLAGFIYHLNVFGVRRIKFPGFVTSFFSRLSWPSSGRSPSRASRGNIVGSVPSIPGRQREGNYPPSAPLVSVVEPPENSIGTLVAMGFDRNSARQALVQARNDINVATNILLETQSH
ncbi:rhomboid-like protein 20 [Tasmannia lanceolata]|uniref:rhomboid-like protein 20 n=1 Tax=Tasmannia lanceolata TaxID=3420 RepID=UPI004064B91F